MQIDSFMELPKKKRPPESIWDDPKELDRWFDRIFGDNGKSSGLDVIITDIEE